MARLDARKTRFATLGVALLASSLWIACDDNGTDVDLGDDGNEELGTLTTVVHDSAAVLPEGRTTPVPADSASYTGTITGTAQVEVFSDIDGWTPVGEPTEVTFEVYCEEAAVVDAQADVAPGSYSQVRLTLTDFVANVAGGAVIQGTTYVDPFTVGFGDGSPVVVEKTVTPFTISTGGVTTLIFDLNTELWLDDGTISAGVAPAAEIEAATNVIIR
jgi:hypothetical protein